ncbi:MAG TPA: endolytic transglycosylase MltG [Candidatus Paceibacterota bacterium]|jgi:UPF0755 protein
MELTDIQSRMVGFRNRMWGMRARLLYAALALVFLIGIGIASYLLLLPPRTFPTGALISIPEDATVSEMTSILRNEGAIRSTFVFRAYTRLTMQDRSLASGFYVFERPLGIVPLVYRMTHSRHGIEPYRVTLTEGMTVDDMAVALAGGIPGFDTEAFLELASTSEGYLFPDTYFFMPGTEADDAFARLRARFDERVETIGDIVAASGRTLPELVIMASLLEREAQGQEDMRVVAGILWKRLDMGMLLQVDAVFGYINGENGYTPTAADLASDSPYNTYMHEGLPPGPISNPGIESLIAAATPTPTDYLYYLTGRDGKMYYGRTFEEHKQNRALYLD